LFQTKVVRFKGEQIK